MPMRATTVRFDEALWQLVEREAAREGVSAAQYVRDAAVLRAAYEMGRRGDADFEASIERVRGPHARPAIDESARRRRLLEAAAAVQDPGRLAAVHGTGLLDSGASPEFDRLARLASRVLDAPVALVSLVDRDRQYFKSCLGLHEPWAGARETPLTHSFCQHTVARREPLIVEDAREDPVLRENLAIRDLGVVAYAGIPLIDRGGHALGSLCVIDSRPRHWTGDQVELLRDIAASVVTEISLAMN
jgi:GAF domain-containing protein